MVIVRTEPKQCWAFVSSLVSHRAGAVSVRGRNTMSDKEYHPEILSRTQLLLQSFLLDFVATKKAAMPLLELTRTMVMLCFKFSYAAHCLTSHPLQVLP